MSRSTLLRSSRGEYARIHHRDDRSPRRTRRSERTQLGAARARVRRCVERAGRLETDPLIGEALRAKSDGEHDRALALLDRTGDLPAREQARAKSIRGRIALARGDIEGALALLERSSEEHAEAGSISRGIDDDLVRAYVLILYARSLKEAREVLERARARASGYADGRANLPYYFGLLARESGDLTTALELFEEAEKRAERLGLEDVRQSSRQMRATAFVQLGRAADALSLLEELARAPNVDPCARAVLLVNLGWARFVAEESGARGLEARAPLEEALAIFSTACPRKTGVANAQVNLALAALAEGHAAGARRHFDAASASEDSLGAEARLWMIELEGRLALLENRLDAAAKAFVRLRAAAEAAFAGDVLFRAWLGEARALLALGRRAAALQAYTNAERVLAGESLAIPLLEARHGYLAARDRAARELVELLIEIREPARALAVARRTRAQLGSRSDPIGAGQARRREPRDVGARGRRLSART